MKEGVDILASNKDKELIGVEIKAHHKFEPIKERNVQQLRRFMDKEKLHGVILVTTSSRINTIVLGKITILDYPALLKLCNDAQREAIEYIREISVHQETNEKEEIRNKILLYAKQKFGMGEDINCKDISTKFNVGFYTYFNNIWEIYEELSVSPPASKKNVGRYYPASPSLSKREIKI